MQLKVTKRSLNLVKGIECYEEPSGMQGVSGPAMETRYAIKLQLEFVGVDKRQGDPANPKDLYSIKMLPEGESNIDGLI